MIFLFPQQPRVHQTLATGFPSPPYPPPEVATCLVTKKNFGFRRCFLSLVVSSQLVLFNSARCQLQQPVLVLTFWFASARLERALSLLFSLPSFCFPASQHSLSPHHLLLVQNEPLQATRKQKTSFLCSFPSFPSACDTWDAFSCFICAY